jgi:hypothetical protein
MLQQGKVGQIDEVIGTNDVGAWNEIGVHELRGEEGEG